MMTPPFFTNDVEDMLDLKRMKTDIVNDDDISAMMKKTTDLLNEKKSNVEVRIMYTCYQNLWTKFGAIISSCERWVKWRCLSTFFWISER